MCVYPRISPRCLYIHSKFEVICRRVNSLNTYTHNQYEIIHKKQLRVKLRCLLFVMPNTHTLTHASTTTPNSSMVSSKVGMRHLAALEVLELLYTPTHALLF